jgi:two-component system NarL family sensor kinase
VVAAGYAAAALGVAAWTRGGGPTAVRWAWVALFLDLAVLAWLTLLTGVRTPQSWTSDVLTTGFLLIPVLAAAQLRPRVCAAVVVPAVTLYLVAGVATRAANDEPWASLLLRTLVMAGVGAACVALSWIQRSRVATISRLVQTRTDLLAELTALERRERRALSEQLHDGALQYVLAARQDLDDARDTGSPEAFDRLEEALVESSRLLRTTVAELHPAVLERAGLPAALRDLTAATAARGGFAADVDLDGWPADLRTPIDGLLYRTARELLGNVAKHAHADRVVVGLTRADGAARLTVADDGVGVRGANGQDGIDLGHRLGEGHIGLASHALRVEAAGGRLTVVPGVPAGTVATVELPLPATVPGPTGDDPAVTNRT